MNFWLNFEMDVFYPRPEYSRLETALVEKMDKGLILAFDALVFLLTVQKTWYQVRDAQSASINVTYSRLMLQDGESKSFMAQQQR